MLKHLSIKNFAVIEDISVDFKEGMNVLIGETGAGKSIIIDALSLLKGEKSLFDKIRNGEDKALIEGEFVINNKSLITSLNEEYGDLIEDDTIYVSRSLDTNGKSVCRLNYHNVPLSVLKKVMEKIIDIHSQHKNNAYFDDAKQILFVDEFIKKISLEEYNTASNKYSLSYQAYVNEINKLNEMKKLRESIDDLDYLQFQYDELTKANIKENEIEEVESELKTLESFEEFASLMRQFDDEYNNGSSSLYNAKKLISGLKNDKFASDAERFISSYYELEDAHESLMNLFNDTAEGLDRIDYLKQRKSLFASLKRKYGSSTKEILDKYETIKEQIELIGDYEYNLQNQEKIISDKQKEAVSDAGKLTILRNKAGKELEKNVNQQIHDLLLDNADFKIQIEKKDLSSSGSDKVTFMIRANAGGKYLPISESASLGETSRINLGIKNVFNHLEPAETIIFDEIDTGISGRVAIATSKKIHSISSESQSIVISHLPQVAASGDHHYYVSKEVKEGKTCTSVHELNKEETLNEIAKIITGVVTKESLKIAESLIEEVKE